MASNTSPILVESTEPSVVKLPITLDASYQGDNITRSVKEILDLPDIRGWSVLDHKDNLALIHYDDDADMAQYGELRGIVVDTQNRCMVANSFGCTPTAIASHLEMDEERVIHVTDQNNLVHSFPVETTTITRVFEGVVLRAIWHNSKLHLISHKKLDPSRSRWGPSSSFTEMWEEASGPKAEDLFDTSRPYSSTCYVFLVVHPQLLVGTRQSIQAPYIVHLSTNAMPVSYPADQVAPGRMTIETDSDITSQVTTPFIHSPLSLTLESANYHLKYGYYHASDPEDIRQLTGEAVIMWREEDGEIMDIVKVHSPAYEWRCQMRGNNHNIRNQFYSLLNIAYPDIARDDANWQRLQDRLILLPRYSASSIAELYNQNGSILLIPQTEVFREDYGTRDDRIYLLWMNYLLSLPSNHQASVLNLYTEFESDRKEAIAWVQDIERRQEKIEDTEYADCIKRIIKSSRRLARQRMQEGNNRSVRGATMNLPTLIKTTIRNLIYKEYGPNLYGIIRDMKAEKNPPVEESTIPEVIGSDTVASETVA